MAFVITLAVVIVACALLAFGVYYGHQLGYQHGHASGYSDGYGQGRFDAEMDAANPDDGYAELYGDPETRR